MTEIPPHDFQEDLDIVAAIPAVETILQLVCQVTGMGFAAVARVTEDRWVCCAAKDDIAFGLKPGGELAIETTICNEILDSRQGVAIDHVSEHPHFSRHHTPAMYGFQSYISLPVILADGSMFGTLCAIDPRPAQVDTPRVIDMFKTFADLIALHIDSRRRLAASEAMLLTERNVAELREQFIAILGHDLRNPLMALQAGTQLLQRGATGERASDVLKNMQASILRMSELIANMLDFARGRMGGGLPLSREMAELEPMLDLVVRELQSAHPARRIAVTFSRLGAVPCDPRRIGQLLSNLLSNALLHGAADKPVEVRAAMQGDSFELSVINQGRPMPPSTANRLFQPFARAAEGRTANGLGLGLYIAAEIAKAHGGTLSCESADGTTVFTFRMPV